MKGQEINGSTEYSPIVNYNKKYPGFARILQKKNILLKAISPGPSCIRQRLPRF